jgi:hypothetical protein
VLRQRDLTFALIFSISAIESLGMLIVVLIYFFIPNCLSSAELRSFNKLICSSLFSVDYVIPCAMTLVFQSI